MHYLDLYENINMKESVRLNLPNGSSWSDFVNKFKSSILKISGRDDIQISAIVNNLKGFKKNLNNDIDNTTIEKILKFAQNSITPENYKNYIGKEVNITAKPRENTLDITFPQK
jgi:hypothetical protein